MRFISLIMDVSLQAFMSLQVMQYASPKAIWNMFFGAGSPSFGSKQGLSSMMVTLLTLFVYCKKNVSPMLLIMKGKDIIII